MTLLWNGLEWQFWTFRQTNQYFHVFNQNIFLFKAYFRLHLVEKINFKLKIINKNAKNYNKRKILVKIYPDTCQKKVIQKNSNFFIYHEISSFNFDYKNYHILNKRTIKSFFENLKFKRLN
uniref:CSON002079 protein n=1 Tax=Culicoides sonorensis TaxID=179676 RepID=A0A336MPC2_CULSO